MLLHLNGVESFPAASSGAMADEAALSTVVRATRGRLTAEFVPRKPAAAAGSEAMEPPWFLMDPRLIHCCLFFFSLSASAVAAA